MFFELESKKLVFLLPKNEHQKVKSRFFVCLLNILNNSIMAFSTKNFDWDLSLNVLVKF